MNALRVIAEQLDAGSSDVDGEPRPGPGLFVLDIPLGRSERVSSAMVAEGGAALSLRRIVRFDIRL